MAKPRRGKITEIKKPKKFEPAPITQYNRTPTPEPPRDPNFVFVPGLHNPLNLGHVTIEDPAEAVETARNGGKYPTRPGSRKRRMSSFTGNPSCTDDRPRLLKRLKSAHEPRGYHGRTRLQHAASVALYQAMSHTNDFTKKDQTVSDVLLNSTPMALACIATLSPNNGAARMDIEKKIEKADLKAKGKELPLGMNGDWNDWVMLLYMRRWVEGKLAENPTVPCAADRQNVWGPTQLGDDDRSPATEAAYSQDFDTIAKQNTPEEVPEDVSEDEGVEVVEMALPKKHGRTAEDAIEEIDMGPPKKRSKTATPRIEESISPIESSVATPQDEKFVTPSLKLAVGELNIPVLPEPKIYQHGDGFDSGKLKILKPQALERIPKSSSPKTQVPTTQASKTEVPTQQADKVHAPKSNILKPKPSKLQSPESTIPEPQLPGSQVPIPQDPELGTIRNSSRKRKLKEL